MDEYSTETCAKRESYYNKHSSDCVLVVIHLATLGGAGLNFVFKSRMRPRLPRELELLLPSELVHVIYQYVPHMEKERPRHSPTLQKELQKLQNLTLKGKSANFMRGLDDFCLD
jgi:hypothetical protein